MQSTRRVVMDPFCFKQFEVGASCHIPFDRQSFEQKINQLYDPSLLKAGYAPFCKHLFVENFTEAIQSAIPILPANQHLLYSVYEARTEKQLPVLKRYFPKSAVTLSKAKYLDIILYSKEQVQKENAAMKNVDPNAEVPYQYGIVSVKPSDVDYETPMDPITMMRNALGKEEGGSGVPLDRQQYLESVKYWTAHALVK